jgi:fibronectin type 3 domain-containing protein
MLGSPTALVLVSVLSNEIDIQFTGVAGADHYDIYRSSSAQDIGSKINLSAVPQTASPYTVSYADKASNSVVAPAQGNLYFYRAVAVDALGAVSIPSSSLEVMNVYPPLLTPEAPILLEVQQRGS